MLTFCLIFPWLLNNESAATNAPRLNESSIGSYESSICTYNFLDFVMKI